MGTKNLIAALLSTGLLLGAGAYLQGQAQRQAPKAVDTPAGQPLQLVDAVPFTLDQPATHYWRKERPSYQGGYLLVLRADQAFLRPRQSHEPVLFVGSQTAERLNNPERSGYLVCLVPAPLSQDSQVLLDPTQEPIWFGSYELPERIDAARIQGELDQAMQLGVAPRPRLGGKLASRTGRKAAQAPGTVHMADRTQLDLVIADLIESYSPEESDRIESLRMPLSR